MLARCQRFSFFDRLVTALILSELNHGLEVWLLRSLNLVEPLLHLVLLGLALREQIVQDLDGQVCMLWPLADPLMLRHLLELRPRLKLVLVKPVLLLQQKMVGSSASRQQLIRAVPG